MTHVAFPQAFLIRLLRDLIDNQTWTDEGSVTERMLRSQLLLLACVRKYPPCVQRAEAYFREWKESDGNLRSVLTEQPGSSHEGCNFCFRSSVLNVGRKNKYRQACSAVFLGKVNCFLLLVYLSTFCFKKCRAGTSIYKSQISRELK